MGKIFTDENNNYQFDFSKSVSATNQLNSIYHNAKIALSDVDFIVELEESILFIEYKNANVKNATNPDSFRPKEDKSLNQVAKKFYDSFIYVNSTYDVKAKSYIYILEAPAADKFLRSQVRENLKCRLPFLLQRQNNFKSKLIQDVKVLSIDEWNKMYPQFPVQEICD